MRSSMAAGRWGKGRERPAEPEGPTRTVALSSPRLAVLCDFPAEGWRSMDLAAEMLLTELHGRHADRCRAVRVCPSFRRRLTRLPGLGRRAAAVNADRLLNRFWDYPRHLRRRRPEFDVFHL